MFHYVDFLFYGVKLGPNRHSHSIWSPQILLMLSQGQFVKTLYRKVILRSRASRFAISHRACVILLISYILA